MEKFRADLHCHSTSSDGSFTPEMLIFEAKKRGLDALSITDHDTVDAYLKTIPCAQKEGVILLTGIELSAYHDKKSVHILGYGVDINAKPLKELCAWHGQRRTYRNRAILENLQRHGMVVEESELLAIATEDASSIGRPHIALALVSKGYVATVQEAFNKYLGDGKPCFSQGPMYSVEDTIATIHSSGGVAVLAHPHLLKDDKLLGDILCLPLDGIECMYGNFSTEKNQRWINLAKKRGLLITGGSDFHGIAKPAITLGSSSIGKEEFQKLQEAITRRKG